MTPTEQDKELRGIVGEIPNYIFECLELSDEIKEEWKYGSKASDFGSHNQFVQRFSKRIEAFITADRKRVALEARIDEINYLDDNFQADSQDWEREHPGYSTAMIPMEDYIRRRTELKAQQEEV